MELNQRVGAPYGDIHFVSTPAIDKQVSMLYAEQQKKLAAQDRAIQDLDNEFSKNISGIRDVDIPDLTKAYGDYKLAAKGLIKIKNATPEQQLEVLRKRANVFEVVGKSKAQKEAEKLQAADLMKKPNKYVRDAHTGLVTVMNTPVSKIGDVDVFEPLKYKGNMSNFTKLLGDATGKEIKLDDEIIDNPKELRKDVTHVSRLNNAKEYYDKLISGVVGSQGADDFIRTFDVPDEQYNAVKQQYQQKLADPVMRKRLGLEAIDLPPDENLTELEKTAKFLAMQHQLMTNPIVKEGRPISSTVAVMDKRRKEGMEDWKTKNAITYQQSLAKIRLNNENRKAGLPSEETGYLSDEVASEYGVPEKIYLGGKERDVTVVYTENVDPSRMNIITGKDLSKKQNGVKPIPIKQKDGSMKFGYYVDAGTGDWEGENGQKISRERVKDDYIKSVAPTKQKLATGTKASENTKGTTKPAVKPKKDPLGLF